MLLPSTDILTARRRNRYQDFAIKISTRDSRRERSIQVLIDLKSAAHANSFIDMRLLEELYNKYKDLFVDIRIAGGVVGCFGWQLKMCSERCLLFNRDPAFLQFRSTVHENYP
ncbi:uncharacterized protein LOC110925480 [Helianthus annuus]|uniref:uncharacterized protein LOC110925480 n=1 Tax=Helianthus annuus TaxID=4232 RepID=UPI0016530AB8|nr:uncharacterized protein LOC110925480 [Helianthus annuus]